METLAIFLLGAFTWHWTFRFISRPTSPEQQLEALLGRGPKVYRKGEKRRPIAHDDFAAVVAEAKERESLERI